MSWIDDLKGGIQQVTDIVEDVGDLGSAIGGAIDTVPTDENGVRDPYAVAFASIQTKINQGVALNASDVSNKKLLESRGYKFSEVYSLDNSFSSGTSNAGIQTTGLLGDILAPAITSGVTNALTTAQGAGGLSLPWWKGADGKLQAPWNDPRVPEYLKQFALDDAYLKTYVRAPRGYVIVRDASGRPFAVNRQIARQFGIWRPAAKPPISATDWKHYKRNKAIEKKLVKIARPALRAHSRPAKTTKGRK
jgi:hypothetical protein